MDRTAVVFVHGLFSSPATWNAFRDLLHDDPDITQRFDLNFFAYDTPYIRVHPGRKTPDLDTVAAGLGTYLETDLAAYRQLVLVTHSQGGLVAQRFLTRFLQDGKGERLARICGLVMFACPNSGSEFALSLRKSLTIWQHPQERELRPLAPTILETQRLMLERVVYATSTTATHCPIPVIAYAAESDGIVLPASAISAYPRAGVLPGDHNSVIRPDTRNHRCYVALRGDLFRLVEAVESRPDMSSPIPMQTRQPDPRHHTPPPPAIPATELAPMVHALLAIDEVADGTSRRQIISYLPPHIRAIVPDATTARLHVVALVRTCAGYGDYGRQTLEEALVLAAGDQRDDVVTALSVIADKWPKRLLAEPGEFPDQGGQSWSSNARA